MNPVEVIQGNSPVVLGLPHTGTDVPPDIFARLTGRGQELADTDWHIHRLYDGLLDGVSSVRATFHRYVIDANRAPNDESLYPGQNTTGLVPVTDFDGAALWHENPEAGDIRARREAFHAPYHAALRHELERVRAVHGVAVLYDCHSIRSNIPYLFDGTLPDFNIGTNGGTTCAANIERAVQDICALAGGYSCITNGRFKGGWSTRHYGLPETGIHAIQMELAQSTYLGAENAPWSYDADKAMKMRNHLGLILVALDKLARKSGDLT